jgi:broad specificity phosphatase PhoE
MAVLFITHPEVLVDPNTDVTLWRLSPHGIERMRSFVASDAVAAIDEVWSSTETKAIEAAGLLAARFGLPVHLDPDLGENDRSATGFVPPDQFERLADEFFARPAASVRGWETAQAAQARIVAALNKILERRSGTGDLAIVAHGGVGTLLLCSLLGAPISRERDQPFQGHYWAFDPATAQVVHEWRAVAPR